MTEEFRNQGCASRIGMSLVSGAVFGGLIGGSQLLFQPDVVGRGGVTVPRTATQAGRVIGGMAMAFSLVAGSFALGDCTMETISNGKGVQNSVGGGIAAGVTAGLLAGSARKGAAAAGLLAILAGVTDYGGGRVIQQGEQQWAKMMPWTKG